MSGKHTPSILADAAGIARGAEILRAGGLVAIPTETVYGLAARADDPVAVARIFAAKGRPAFNPLIVHVAELAEAEALAEFTPEARRFAEASWPGPVTLVLPRRADAMLAPAVSAGLASVAIRVPRHPVAQAVLRATGVPLAAPSANRSGFVSPTSAAHVLETLGGRIDLVLDAGPSEEGVESTILKLREDGRWEQLRAGPQDILLWHDSFFARLELSEGGAPIEAPGQLASHYSPSKPVRLGAAMAEADEFLIGFGAVGGEVSLSRNGDLAEAGRRLYACLHEAARSAKPRIAVAPVPEMRAWGWRSTTGCAARQREGPRPLIPSPQRRAVIPC